MEYVPSATILHCGGPDDNPDVAIRVVAKGDGDLGLEAGGEGELPSGRPEPRHGLARLADPEGSANPRFQAIVLAEERGEPCRRQSPTVRPHTTARHCESSPRRCPRQTSAGRRSGCMVEPRRRPPRAVPVPLFPLPSTDGARDSSGSGFSPLQCRCSLFDCPGSVSNFPVRARACDARPWNGRMHRTSGLGRS